MYFKNTEELDVAKTVGDNAFIQITRYAGEVSEWNVVFSDQETLEDAMYIGKVTANNDNTGFDIDTLDVSGYSGLTADYFGTGVDGIVTLK